VGGVDLDVVERRAGHAAGAVVQVAIKQTLAFEAGALGDPVDGSQDRVNLELIGADFFLGQAAGVCALADQPLEPPSAVPMMLLARLALSIAVVMPTCSLLRFWLAIRPAGSSLPLLIFKPVLRRWRLVLSAALLLASDRCAIRDGTLVLILAMLVFP
jgi:hypothetical protein